MSDAKCERCGVIDSSVRPRIYPTDKVDRYEGRKLYWQAETMCICGACTADLALVHGRHEMIPLHNTKGDSV